MAATPVSLWLPLTWLVAAGRLQGRSTLYRAADASVADLHPLLDRLAILTDGQRLFNVEGWPRAMSDYRLRVRLSQRAYNRQTLRVLGGQCISCMLRVGEGPRVLLTVHNHSNLFPMLGGEDVVQERRLAGTEVSYTFLQVRGSGFNVRMKIVNLVQTCNDGDGDFYRLVLRREISSGANQLRRSFLVIPVHRRKEEYSKARKE